ncbi:leucine-rich repeat domain-containing protein, partial [uncultured Ruminococcus sp.]|uniref:leucine-rich repeat domain-containing protein n=1 Tax=uncultured Ruminococcus sp. TaxID=165186 RepID=UPI00266F42CB
MKFWKKVLASVTAGVLCLGGAGLSGAESVQESMGTVLSASAYVPYSYDGRYEGLYYNVTDTGEIEITGCYEYVRKVNIPIEIDGKSVTSIGSSAFYDCTSLTEITIPDSVTSIRECAFYDCTSLKNVYISDINAWFEIDFDDLDSNPMCNGANLYCNGELVTEVAIPDSMESIGSYVFSYCTSLTKITIPDSVTSIGECAFYD